MTRYQRFKDAVTADIPSTWGENGLTFGVEKEVYAVAYNHPDLDDFVRLPAALADEPINRLAESGHTPIMDTSVGAEHPKGVEIDYDVAEGVDPTSFNGDMPPEIDKEIRRAYEHASSPGTLREVIAQTNQLVEETRHALPPGTALLLRGMLPESSMTYIDSDRTPENMIRHGALESADAREPAGRYDGLQLVAGDSAAWDAPVPADKVAEYTTVTKNGEGTSIQLTGGITDAEDDWDASITAYLSGTGDHPSMQTGIIFPNLMFHDSGMYDENGEQETTWGRHEYTWIEALADSPVDGMDLQERYGMPKWDPDTINDVDDIVDHVMNAPAPFAPPETYGDVRDPDTGKPLSDIYDLDPDTDVTILPVREAGNGYEITADSAEEIVEDMYVEGVARYVDEAGELHTVPAYRDWAEDMTEEEFFDGPAEFLYQLQEGTHWWHTRPKMLVGGMEERPTGLNPYWTEAVGMQGGLKVNWKPYLETLQSDYDIGEDQRFEIQDEIAENGWDATINGYNVAEIIDETKHYFIEGADTVTEPDDPLPTQLHVYANYAVANQYNPAVEEADAVRQGPDETATYLEHRLIPADKTVK